MADEMKPVVTTMPLVDMTRLVPGAGQTEHIEQLKEQVKQLKHDLANAEHQISLLLDAGDEMLKDKVRLLESNLSKAGELNDQDTILIAALRDEVDTLKAERDILLRSSPATPLPPAPDTPETPETPAE